MARATDTTDVRVAKEGPMPGYTGHVPGVKCHVTGHSFSDASKRGVAISETLRRRDLARSVHLSTENRVNGEQDFYAELTRAGERMDPRALVWRCTVRDAPAETRHASGKVDLKHLRQCIGTTDSPAQPAVPMHMSVGALPYKDTKLVLRKEWDLRGPEYHEVNRGEHHMKGYTGHTHSEQHVFAKTYGKTTRELRHFPAGPSTSAKYINYAENRPLVVNEFELKQGMRLPHNVLLKEGEGTLGPLPEGVGISSMWKPPQNNDSSHFKNSQKDCYDET